MHTRRTFLWAIGAGLWTLANGKAGAQTAASVPSPVDVVKQFVAARTAQDYAKAYALLSADTQKGMSFKQFADDKPVQDALAQAVADGTSPLTTALGILFVDTHNKIGYRFTVIGADPTDPNAVVVNAQPPTKYAKLLALRIVTVFDTNKTLRIALLPTYKKTVPGEMDAMRVKARQKASLSNLKTIALSFFQYDTDHKHLPDAAEWVDAIQPYLGNTYMLRDPSAPDGQEFSYAFNRSLSGIAVRNISYPSHTVLEFASARGVKNAADTGQSLPKPGWHSGGSIVAFCDGNVKWMKDGTPLSFTP